MGPETVLIPTGCDLKRLPLDASEVFLLSRLDGQMTLDEVGEISGLGYEKARRLAERLVILGAVKPKGGAEKPASAEPVSTSTAASTTPKRRFDPRAEEEDEPPRKPERTEERVASKAPEPKPEPKPEAKRRRSSSKGMKAQPAIAASRAPTSTPVKNEPCELDSATQEKITAMDAKIARLDHYGVLGVARDADKKEIKRAYFALASVFHPDRFFGKKMGAIRVPLDRVFMRLTEANDVLATRQGREAYDAKLPPLPASSRAPTSTEPKVESKPEPPPEPPKPIAIPAPPPTSPRLSKRMRRSQLMAAAAPASTPAIDAPPPSSSPNSLTADPEKFKRLQAAAKMLASQTRSDALVKAAEDAIKAGDILGAANNYRLALQMHDDPVIKDKLAAIDRHSRDLRSEKYVVKARAAERAERWDEAAEHYVRANESRKEAAVAERAANALRMSRGDLRQATQLAEQAVAEYGKNAEYHVTLAEVLLAASFAVRAKEVCELAVKLAPSNPRVVSLQAAIKKL